MSDDWKSVRLSEHVDIAIGGTPSRAMPVFWAEKPAGHPWLAISDLRSKHIDDTREHISDLGVRSSNVKLIPAGSTVMSFKLSIGRTAIAVKPMYSNEAIAAFLPRSDSVDSAWLYHVLPRSAGTVVTDSAVKGATLNKAKMAEMTVMLPSPAEQQLVAQVLDTLDTTIRLTEAIIEKLKQVKQGLLHDLLTRGIADNGELRPPQSEAPHLYKESVLGWIPKEWVTKRLDEFCTSVADGTHDSPKPAHTGYPLITSKNLRGGRLDLTDSYLIAEADYRAVRARSSVEPGDLLFGMIGTIGSPVIIERGQDQIATKNVGLLRVGGDFRRGRFLRDWLESASIERQLSEAMSGSTQRFIGLGTLRSLLVVEPEVDEIGRVVEAAQLSAARIDSEARCLSKLEITKRGLMDDLLTGRVRVTPLLNAET